MQVYQVKFYVYAQSQNAADKLQRALYRLVEDKRSRSIAVTAEALTAALDKYANNYFVEQFLKKNQ